MNRRRFILTAGAVGTFAGCVSEQNRPSNEDKDDNKINPTPDTRFQLIDYETPENNEVPIGEEGTWSITIENDTEETAVFESDVILCEGACPDSEYWQKVDEIEFELSAGEAGTYEYNIESWDVLRALTYRIPHLDHSIDLNITAERLRVGETTHSPDDVLVAVEDVEVKDTYTYVDNGQDIEVESDSDTQWAFAWVECKHDNQGEAMLPRQRDFHILDKHIEDGIDHSVEYEYVSIEKTNNEYTGEEVLPDTTRSGWIAFEIPTEVSNDGFLVVWEAGWGERYACNWS